MPEELNIMPEELNKKEQLLNASNSTFYQTMLRDYNHLKND